MAGRFVFQELASGMSRSTSRLGAQGSAWSGATAPVITASVVGTRPLSNVFHGAAIHPGTALPSSSRGLHDRVGGGFGTLSNFFRGAAVRPGMVVPSKHEILSGCEDGIRTLSDVFHGAAIHPGTVLPSSSRGLHSHAASRCLNTATAKTGRSTNGMPSSIIEDRLHEQNMKIIKLQTEFEITKKDMELLRHQTRTEVVKGQRTMLKYAVLILGAGVVAGLLADWLS